MGFWGSRQGLRSDPYRAGIPHCPISMSLKRDSSHSLPCTGDGWKLDLRTPHVAVTFLDGYTSMEKWGGGSSHFGLSVANHRMIPALFHSEVVWLPYIPGSGTLTPVHTSILPAPHRMLVTAPQIPHLCN